MSHEVIYEVFKVVGSMICMMVAIGTIMPLIQEKKFGVLKTELFYLMIFMFVFRAAMFNEILKVGLG